MYCFKWHIITGLSLTYPCYVHFQIFVIGPSGVRALPLAAGINDGGHYFRYFGPSGVRALPLAANINEGGHYFAYFGPSGAVQTVSDSRRPLF